jgi:protein ImuB
LHTLPEIAAHAETLAPMGCRTLGDVRGLPRAGLSRRLGAGLRQAMDRADGTVPDVLDWLRLPEVFEERLELPGRVEVAAAMMHGATTLLSALVAWLAGRQSGVSALTLLWRHDFHRRDAGPGGQCTVHLAEPTRDLARLQRLLAEHLAHVTLAGPVGELRLCADQISPLPLSNGLLFAELGSAAAQLLSHAPKVPHAPHGQAQHQALQALLEHLSARLGPEQVRLGEVVPDHRPERAQRWRPWSAQAAGTSRAASARVVSWWPMDWPLPTWLSPKPLCLALLGRAAQRDLPQYHGPLCLLAGPHRVEAGWWDPAGPEVARDYYLALSPGAGLLWVFRERPGLEAPSSADSPWFLHGWLA